MAKPKAGAKKAPKASAKKAKSPPKKAAKVISKKIAPKKAAGKKSTSKKSAKTGSPKSRKSAGKSAGATLKNLAFGAIEHVEHFSAAPEVVYRAFTDGKLHAAFTGAVAKISAKVGAAFKTHGKYIQGRIVELVPGERIVQAWRTLDFPKGYPDSKLEIRLTPENGGTRLRLLHTQLPAANVETYDSGWHTRYWQPLRAWLSTLPSLDLVSDKPTRSKSTKRRQK